MLHRVNRYGQQQHRRGASIRGRMERRVRGPLHPSHQADFLRRNRRVHHREAQPRRRQSPQWLRIGGGHRQLGRPGVQGAPTRALGVPGRAHAALAQEECGSAGILQVCWC